MNDTFAPDGLSSISLVDTLGVSVTAMSSQLSLPEQRPGFYRTASSSSTISSRSSRALALTRSFSFRKDKTRLYLALFPKGGPAGGTYGSQFTCDSYHWALVLGPKSSLRSEAGIAYHVVHAASGFTDSSFFYEESDLGEQAHLSRNILARIALAKVVDEQHVVALIRAAAAAIQTAQSSSRDSIDSMDQVCRTTCLSWVRSAWEAIAGDSSKPLRTFFGPDEWDNIESRARKYVKRKRLQGRYHPNTGPADITWNVAEIPTWNYWENREITD